MLEVQGTKGRQGNDKVAFSFVPVVFAMLPRQAPRVLCVRRGFGKQEDDNDCFRMIRMSGFLVVFSCRCGHLLDSLLPYPGWVSNISLSSCFCVHASFLFAGSTWLFVVRVVLIWCSVRSILVQVENGYGFLLSSDILRVSRTFYGLKMLCQGSVVFYPSCFLSSSADNVTSAGFLTSASV